jgi:hypothetical protein
MLDSVNVYAKKILVWLKRNWGVPVLIVLAVSQYFIYSSRVDDLRDTLKIQRTSHAQQVSVLEKSYASEKKKREEIEKRYDENVKKLREAHLAELTKIKEEQAILRGELERDPSRIEEILKRFGIEEFEGDK